MLDGLSYDDSEPPSVGLVPPGATHQLAQDIDPSCRIVYTDSDPLVLSRAQTLVGSTPVSGVMR